jgi:hypothetical protein
MKNLTLFVLLTAGATSQIGNKFMEGSVVVTPSPAAKEFFAKYTQAINTRSFEKYVGLMSPESQKCYNETKHPEYYKEEIGRWLEQTITSFKELRKFKADFNDGGFYAMMKYPVRPTHMAIFNSESTFKSGRKGVGFISIEVIEKGGRYSIAYRCM